MKEILNLAAKEKSMLLIRYTLERYLNVELRLLKSTDLKNFYTDDKGHLFVVENPQNMKATNKYQRYIWDNYERYEYPEMFQWFLDVRERSDDYRIVVLNSDCQKILDGSDPKVRDLAIQLSEEHGEYFSFKLNPSTVLMTDDYKLLDNLDWWYR